MPGAPLASFSLLSLFLDADDMGADDMDAEDLDAEDMDADDMDAEDMDADVMDADDMDAEVSPNGDRVPGEIGRSEKWGLGAI